MQPREECVRCYNNLAEIISLIAGYYDLIKDHFDEKENKEYMDKLGSAIDSLFDFIIKRNKYIKLNSK